MPKHLNKPEQKTRRRKLRQDQTPAEKLVWRYLRNRQMAHCKFRRQYSVDTYIMDFYSPSLKLAIEIDGSVHSLSEQKEHDKTRQEYLEMFGIKFLRIQNEELFGNPNKAFGRIEKAVRALSTSPLAPNVVRLAKLPHRLRRGKIN